MPQNGRDLVYIKEISITETRHRYIINARNWPRSPLLIRDLVYINEMSVYNTTPQNGRNLFTYTRFHL